MSDITWTWETGDNSIRSNYFVLSERQALKADSMVEDLWKWANRNEFDLKRARNEMYSLQRELGILKANVKVYMEMAAKIESLTKGGKFPGLFPAGPSLVGEDEEGNYYQVVDGIIERD